MADGTTAAPRSRRRRKAEPITTPDAIEIAMEAEAAGHAPQGVAGELLRRQSVLVGWEIADRRASFALKVLTGCVGVAAAIVLALMVWQASQARGVLLEPFTVPPNLVGDGVSGEVVASQVLDELARLRAETVTPSSAQDYRNDWGHSIKVSIPGSGVSLGDLQDALRQWFGQETRITGEVYRTPGGLAMRARIPGHPGLKVEGSATSLEPMAQALAHQIYRETQPLRYAAWLRGHERPAEAIAIAQRIALSGASENDRALAYKIWAEAKNTQGDAGAAVAVARAGLQLAPDRSDLWQVVARNENNQGHWEAAATAYQEVIRRRPRDRRLPPEWRSTSYAEGDLAILRMDFAKAFEKLERAGADPMTALGGGADLDQLATNCLSRLHDIGGARARVMNPEFAHPWEPVRNQYQGLQARAMAAYAAEDWPEVLAATDAYIALPVRFVSRDRNSSAAMNMMARAKTGDTAGARLLLRSFTADSDPVSVYMARTLATLGDFAEADRLLATVQRRAPSVGWGPLWRGRLRLEAGQAAEALPFFAEAARRAPRFADPLKYRGDALASLGRWEEADAAYAAAEPLAPKWGGLHLMRGEALSKLGKADAARAHWQTAGALYLTPDERTRLGGLAGGA